MNRIEPVHAVERETLWVRIRRRPLAQQIALAVAVLAILLLAAWFFYPRPAAQAAAPPPTPVGVIVVTEQPVTLTTELPGRTSPYETSDVRPQVDGIIRARLFTEGDYVRAGQPLYRIDPVTYEARVANARAALARAQASTIGAEGQVRRYAELVKRDFVSQAALRQCRFRRRRGARRRRRPGRGAALGPDRPRPHPDPSADLGPHRPLALHHRRAGQGGAGQCP